MMVTEHSVVVGVDGSPPSLEAVAWAAEDAVRRSLALHILYAFVWPPVYTTVPTPVPSPYELGFQAIAGRVVADAADRARQAAPEVHVTTGTQVESAAAALVRAAGHACEVVVGNRGHSGFAGLILGSVGVQVAAHAPCPVVVVRHTDQPAGPEADRVVIGIDGSHNADAALRFAFEQASSAGIGLTAVLAHRWPGSARHTEDLLPLTHGAGDLREEEQRILARSVAGWRERYPDVDVRTTTVRGRAAEVLVDLSAGARLLVVGSRGRGGFSGLLLGSVSQAAIHHAACPVAVIRHSKRVNA
ncbi:universal stress protein [Dactylosporangium sp. NPDC005555]|uniref:universal stress protein n=1 Tax=Dactylosporangium sp. NPDC005555 TaxID=3154889 RepID=UPI0033ACD33A